MVGQRHVLGASQPSREFLPRIRANLEFDVEYEVWGTQLNEALMRNVLGPSAPHRLVHANQAFAKSASDDPKHHCPSGQACERQAHQHPGPVVSTSTPEATEEVLRTFAFGSVHGGRLAALKGVIDLPHLLVNHGPACFMLVASRAFGLRCKRLLQRRQCRSPSLLQLTDTLNASNTWLLVMGRNAHSPGLLRDYCEKDARCSS